MYDLFNKSQSDIENLQDYNNQLAINIYNLTKIIVFFCRLSDLSLKKLDQQIILYRFVFINNILGYRSK